MFWIRRKAAWFTDPSQVASGRVIENSSRNLRPSQVRVEYHQRSEVRKTTACG
jgi:hypothetical protein